MSLAVRMPRTGGLRSFEHALYDPRATGEVLDALCYFADRAARQRIGFVEGFPFENAFFTTMQSAGACEGVRLYRHARRVEEGTVDGGARVGKVIRDLLTRKNWSDYLAAESTLTLASSLLTMGHTVELVPEHRAEKRPDLRVELQGRSVFIELKAMHTDHSAFEDFVQRLTNAHLLHRLAGDLEQIPETESERIALVDQIIEVVGGGSMLLLPNRGWVAPANGTLSMFLMGRVPCDRCRLLNRLVPHQRGARTEAPEYGPQLDYGSGVKLLVVRTNHAFFAASRERIVYWLLKTQELLRLLTAGFSIVLYEDGPPMGSFVFEQDGIFIAGGADPDDGYGRVVAVVNNPIADDPRLSAAEREAIVRALVSAPMTEGTLA